ncbi:endonuclease domain-containing protein [Microbacterium sp. LWH7-1.2]|uniref:hypothetical protein n=1 Tax=Microbacterium sp. LWH7-1.2 TaxID=3135257 RepID=UPI00313A36AA
MRRMPLPEVLGKVFTIADARTAGVPRSRLRALDLDTPFRGLRVVCDELARLPAERPKAEVAAAAIRANALLYARVMPGNQFFSHVTAAVLWGLPLPSRILTDAFGRPRLLDVAVRAPLRHPRRDGVLGHQVKQRSVAVVDHVTHGVPLTTPAFTWVMLAALVRDDYDLVAIADGVVREPMFWEDPQPLGTLDQLESAVRSGRRVGIRALREALPRVRTRSASRMETRCRLIIVDAGLPEPLLNQAVFDAIGRLIGVVDLAYPELRIALEYEGEHHLRDPEQWAKDIARYEALASAGWFVIRVTMSDVFDGRTGLIRRVRSAVRSRR